MALAAGPWTLGQAQIFDFSGQWDMSTDVTLPGESKPCSFVGTAQVIHDTQQGTLRGTAELELVEGPAPCPAEMTAEISGTPDGTMIFNGLLFGGIWGEATFTGGVQGNVAKGLALGGGFDVIVGPFVGATGGGWGAIVSDGVFRDGFESLIVLSGGTSLLVLAAAGMFIRRRRRA